jgi:Golgi apparatus protein 1
LIQKLTEASRKQKDAMQMLDTECRHEIMRIAELQSEDFHLDRPLFFACREDREVCKFVVLKNFNILIYSFL